MTHVAPPIAEAASNGAVGGCPYAARCAFARPRCLEETPQLKDLDGRERRVSCWYPLA
jgi:hypothetical protein